MKKIQTLRDIEKGTEYLVQQDPALGSALDIVKGAGMEIPLRLRPAGFGALAEIIISQLVSKASANAINQRLVNLVSPLTPNRYLEVGDVTWRKIGLSRPKQRAIQALADALLSDQLDLAKLVELPVEEAQNQLIAVKGIGPWSAQVYLLFCEGHADIFPSGDLALREAARIIWSLEERPDAKEVEFRSRQWSPWRGVAARLLWAFYAAKKGGSETGP